MDGDSKMTKFSIQVILKFKMWKLWKIILNPVTSILIQLTQIGGKHLWQMIGLDKKNNCEVEVLKLEVKEKKSTKDRNMH